MFAPPSAQTAVCEWFGQHVEDAEEEARQVAAVAGPQPHGLHAVALPRGPAVARLPAAAEVQDQRTAGAAAPQLGAGPAGGDGRREGDRDGGAQQLTAKAGPEGGGSREAAN